MTDLDDALGIPTPPTWRMDWDALTDRFAWIRDMRGTVQDPVHHAEGDVWIHTRQVCEAMADLADFRALDVAGRQVAFAAALLHDVAKPVTTRIGDDGRVTAKGHSTRGAMLARQILWRMDVPFAMREEIVALVRHHQAPFWLLERQDPLRLVADMTQTGRARLLALLAEADARGRTCEDQARLLDNVELFRVFCKEHDCFERPFAFPSAHARFSYLGGRQRDPGHRPHEAFTCEVVLMSGLPGAGKDRVVAERFASWPVVSLDQLRIEHDVDPDEAQGGIVAKAREHAREHLRARRSFVWNATNLSRRIRGQCIRLFADYGAKVHIVYVEAKEAVLRAQNRSRSAVVPDDVIDGLLDRWEVPDLTEAHEVTWVLPA